jgi:hypothetical protein
LQNLEAVDALARPSLPLDLFADGRQSDLKAIDLRQRRAQPVGNLSARPLDGGEHDIFVPPALLPPPWWRSATHEFEKRLRPRAAAAHCAEADPDRVVSLDSLQHVVR